MAGQTTTAVEQRKSTDRPWTADKLANRQKNRSSQPPKRRGKQIKKQKQTNNKKRKNELESWKMQWLLQADENTKTKETKNNNNTQQEKKGGKVKMEQQKEDAEEERTYTKRHIDIRLRL